MAVFRSLVGRTCGACVHRRAGRREENSVCLGSRECSHHHLGAFPVCKSSVTARVYKISLDRFHPLPDNLYVQIPQLSWVLVSLLAPSKAAFPECQTPVDRSVAAATVCQAPPDILVQTPSEAQHSGFSFVVTTSGTQSHLDFLVEMACAYQGFDSCLALSIQSTLLCQAYLVGMVSPCSSQSGLRSPCGPRGRQTVVKRDLCSLAGRLDASVAATQSKLVATDRSR